MIRYPIILDDDGFPYAILHNAYDVILSDQVISDSNGSETLEFKLPFNDKKRHLINNEDRILCEDREFIVRVANDNKSNDFYVQITCEALWYEIGNGTPLEPFELMTIDAIEALNYILKDTEWSIGIVEPKIKRTLRTEETISRLAAVRKLPILYECEMYFDTKNKKINLLNTIGKDTNTVISYEYNTDSIRRNIDSREILTRVYLYGKDGLTIRDINKGFEYVENYSYYDELGKKRVIKPTIIKDDRFTNPNTLKEYGEKYLEINSKPKYSYEVKVYIIDEKIELGDRVIVYDKDLNIKGYMRVVSRKINVLEPEKSELQLDNTIKNFTDQMAQNSLDENADVASAVGNALSEVSMFNLLLNSRADYGFNYWINSGFEIDNTKGVTGKASFKCTGELNKEKYLIQEIDVSNREAYTISAQVEIQDLEATNESQLGFELELEYEDGTKEVQFISLI